MSLICVIFTQAGPWTTQISLCCAHCFEMKCVLCIEGIAVIIILNLSLKNKARSKRKVEFSEKRKRYLVETF